MPFGHITPNETGRLRRQKRVVLGSDIDAHQLVAWSFSGFASFVLFFAPDVSWFWKAVGCTAAITLGMLLSAKDGEGRTLLRWLRIVARRASKGAVAVDRGADRSYFKSRPVKKENAATHD